MANRWGNSERLYFFGSIITADGDCSHEIKRLLHLGRKAMTNLDSILKSRDITLPTNVCLVKAMVFPVVMYGCESWTVEKAGAEELMLLNCGVGEDSWKFLSSLSSLKDCKEIQPVYPKGDQSWIFTGRTDAEAETPILGCLMWRTDSFEKTLNLGKIESRKEGHDRGWDGWMASLTQWTWVCRLWELVMDRRPGVLQSMGSQRARHNWVTELNWTKLN